MLSKSAIATSLLLASTLVSAAPVATPSDNAAELSSRSPVLGGGMQNGFIMKGIRPRPRRLATREEHHHHHKRDSASVDARDLIGVEDSTDFVTRGKLDFLKPNLPFRGRGGRGGGRNTKHRKGRLSLAVEEAREKRDLGSVESELVQRQPIFGIFRKVLGGRGIDDNLDSREFDEIVEREPIFGLIKNVFRGKRDLEDGLESRELDELVEREPIFGIFRKVLGGRDLEESLDSRDFDELEERQPIFGIFRKVLGGRDLNEDTLDAREFDELDEREPIFGLIKNVFRGKRDLQSYAELSEREPIIPLLLGGAALASMGRKRDFDDGEVIAREWMGSLDELD